jgi:hypothetical protein
MRPRPAALALPKVMLLIVIPMVLLSGCFTGKRPSVSSDPFPAGAPSGDPAVDQVLAQLDLNNTGPYTADYTVLTKYGNVSRTASVSVDHGRRSVTVGNVRYLTINDKSQTCTLDKPDPCSPSINPAKISDTQITPDFYAIDAAKRLRRDAVSRIGQTVSHVENIAGQSATCVDVPVTGGTAVFCVLAGGPLARVDDAAVTIDLTQFVPTVDESQFTTTR